MDKAIWMRTQVLTLQEDEQTKLMEVWENRVCQLLSHNLHNFFTSQVKSKHMHMQKKNTFGEFVVRTNSQRRDCNIQKY